MNIGNETIIHSNGSKWAGEEPDSIDRLIEVLAEHTIEERFFGPFTVREETEDGESKDVTHYHCPIKMGSWPREGYVRFFGNFEKLSHVFRIDTNDPDVVLKLVDAIKANEGWKKYYHHK